jgi:hypothetical protein
MWRYLPKTFLGYIITYNSSLTAEKFKQRLTELSKARHNSLFCTLYPTTNKFQITSRNSPYVFGGGLRKTSFISAELYKSDTEKVIVKAKISPNHIPLVLFVGLLVLIIAIIIWSINKFDWLDKLLKGLLTLLIVIPIVIGMAEGFAGGLQRDFEEHFSLKCIKID